MGSAKEVWVVVASGPHEHIGQVTHVDGISIDNAHEYGERGEQQHLKTKATSLTLNPAYAFFSPLQQMSDGKGGMGFAQAAIMMPLPLTLSPCPLHLRHFDKIRFLDEFEELDRAEIMKMIEATKQVMLQQKAQRAGITFAGSMPTPNAGMFGLKGPNGRQ